MNWKDLFYYHRTERSGIIILLILIIMISAAPALHRLWQSHEEVDFTAFRLAVSQFRNQQQELLSLKATEPTQATQADEPVSASPVLQLRPFDPNLLSQAEWHAMGIAPHISRTIQNYMKAGGSFRYKEDLARIYMIDDALFAALEPFIELPARPATPATTRKVSPSPATNAKPAIAPAPLTININQADSAELTRLYGIGPVFSRRIVEYRTNLGGFHDVNQLLEVFGMDSTRMAGISEHVVAGQPSLIQIDINTASFEELLHHPYISYNVANSIVSLRTQHGPFQQIEEVCRSALIDQSLFLKLAPYLKVSSDTLINEE